jgi:hypothetical protein
VGRHLPGILQGFPRHLEHHPLLWIQAGRLPRRDAEEGRLETIELREKPAPAGDHLSGCRRILGVEGVDVPTVSRDFDDGIDAVS